MISEQVDQEKIARCKKELIDRYYGSSIIEKVTSVIDFNEKIHKEIRFLEFGKWWYIPREWFTDPSNYPDLVFIDTGRGIANAEKKHIIETILSNDKTELSELQVVTYKDIFDAFRNLISTSLGSTPISALKLVLFAPIKYFTRFYIDWRKEGLQLVPGKGSFVINGFEITPRWSNKYIDFNKFILYESSSCTWIAKPNVRNRLNADIMESNKPGSMEFKVTTVFNFSLSSPEKIQVIKPSDI